MYVFVYSCNRLVNILIDITGRYLDIDMQIEKNYAVQKTLYRLAGGAPCSIPLNNLYVFRNDIVCCDVPVLRLRYTRDPEKSSLICATDIQLKDRLGKT